MNTGRKIYPFLKQIVISTGEPTGVIKPNDPSDPDYVPPVIDYDNCPLIGWQPINPHCIQTSACVEGWVLVGNICQQVVSQPATPPSGSGGSPGVVAKVSNVAYNNGGARIYAPGFSTDGSGTVSSSLTTPHLWVNGDSLWSTATRNLIDSRLNASAIWSQDAVPDGEYIGFSRKVVASTSKVVFVGIAGDNVVKIKVNGVLIVDITNIDGGPNFNFWNIYPITLLQGDNFIEVYGMNQDGPAGFGAEVYDMTEAQLIAATQESDLNILFSTQSTVGENFNLGQTQGYSCPTNWFLDASGSGDPVCTQILTQAPISVNTGQKEFLTRRRLTNGVPDSYEEDNINGTGIGPYFPPIEDTANCPL